VIRSFSELGRYRIEVDESWEHERTKDQDAKIWYEQVPIRGKGFMYLQSQTGCAAYVPSVGILKNLVKALEGSRIAHRVERLDDEGIIFFALADFAAVAKILGAKKKRPAPKQQIIENLVQAGKKFRFATGVQCISDGQI
jgi:hypothetical protein